MNKLDPVVIKRAKQISVINVVLMAVENLGFFLLQRWDMAVLLGSLWGTFIACVCFLLIGISVQFALKKDEKQAANYMKITYLGRLVVVGIGIVVALKLPQLNWIAAIIPLLFTKISIGIIHLTSIKKRRSN